MNGAERLTAAAAQLSAEDLERLADVAEGMVRAARPAPWFPLDPRCCAQATKHTGTCVCSYIARCAVHGEKHHGRH